MNDINYKYFFGGLLCILIAILYLIYLKKDIKKDSELDLFSQSLNWQGIAGGFALLLLGLIMIYGELFK